MVLVVAASSSITSMWFSIAIRSTPNTLCDIQCKEACCQSVVCLNRGESVSLEIFTLWSLRAKFYNKQPLGLFGNYLIYYSVGGSGEGPLKVFDTVRWVSRPITLFLVPYSETVRSFFFAFCEHSANIRELQKCSSHERGSKIMFS